MSDPRRALPPQRRSRSLARLEGEIVQTEATRTRWRTRAEAEEAAGGNSAWARGMLGQTEQRLAQLARSREVLLRGEDGHEDDEPARHEEGRPSWAARVTEWRYANPAQDAPGAAARQGGPSSEKKAARRGAARVNGTYL